MSVNVTRLAGIPLFADLDDQERATLAEALDSVELAAGAAVFRRGDPGDSMFIITDGEVVVRVDDDQGNALVVDRHGAGETIGELSLLDGGPRTGDAVTSEGARLLVFDRTDLVELLARHPRAALDLLGFVGRRLRATDVLARDRAVRSVDVEEEEERTFGDRIADRVAEFGGSWTFILSFLAVMGVWMAVNVVLLRTRAFDPYPFILLNLVLSALASLQAPVIMMSQNRQAAKDRTRSNLDYEVDRRAELKIAHLHRKVDHLQDDLRSHLDRHGLDRRA